MIKLAQTAFEACTIALNLLKCQVRSLAVTMLVLGLVFHYFLSVFLNEGISGDKYVHTMFITR